MLFGVELQIDAKNSNFEIFETALYMRSGSMPLSFKLAGIPESLIQKGWWPVSLLLVSKTRNCGKETDANLMHSGNKKTKKRHQKGKNWLPLFPQCIRSTIYLIVHCVMIFNINHRPTILTTSSAESWCTNTAFWLVVTNTAIITHTTVILARWAPFTCRATCGIKETNMNQYRF